jgi:valyl-tRNA synthetase
MNLSLQRVESNRNFNNKIWNATRFVVGKLGEIESGDRDREQSLADRWIMSRLSRTIEDVNRLFEAHNYGEAGRQIYEFFWSEFADWYIEIAKGQIEAGGAAANSARLVLTRVLDHTLRLLHPFIPFVSEEAWGHLKQAAGEELAPPEGVRLSAHAEGWAEALMIARWPQAGAQDADAEAGMQLIIELIRGIRNVRGEYNVQPGKRIPALIAAGEHAELLNAQKDILTSLARLDDAQLLISPTLAGDDVPEQAASIVSGGVTCYLPLAGLLDLQAERARLQKELEQVLALITRSKGQLASPFAARAPAHVVQRERDKLADLSQQRQQLKARLEDLA